MKRHFLSAFVVSVPVSLAVACSDPPPPTSRTVIESTVNAIGNGSKHKQSDCNIAAVEWLTMGGYGNPSTGTLPRTVDNNQSENGGTAVVTCSVKANGDKYDVAASAQITGGPGAGTISISGSFTEKGDQTPIRGVWQRGDYGNFQQSDCTVTYGDAPQGVAPGRVWGTMHCPDIKSTEGKICNGDVQFRFENCVQ